MNYWRLLAALPFLVVSLRAEAPADVALPEKLLPGLDAILKAAVQQSPRMVSRAVDLEIAENTRIIARSNVLPTVSASYSFYKSQDKQKYLYPNPNSDVVNTYTLTKTPYSLTISQPLFNWGERRHYARIGEIQQNIAQGQYREAYRLLAQELRGGYLHLITQKLALKRAAFSLEFIQTQLKQQEERLAKKVISEMEISLARLNAEQAQIALDRADFEFQNAKLSFARLSGQPALSDDAIPDAIPATVHTPQAYDQLLAGFLAQKELPSTEAAIFRRQLQVENLNYKIVRTRLWPKVSLNAGLTQEEQHNLYGQNVNYSVNSLYAGLAMNWSIFDGFAAGAATRTTLARLRQMETDYRQLTERLAQDAQTQAKLIGFSARNMSIFERYLSDSQGNLQSLKEQFGRGIKSEADVSVAQINLYDTQLGAMNARIDYLQRIGDFLGTVVEDPVLANVSAK